jgi:hypothetical protein
MWLLTASVILFIIVIGLIIYSNMPQRSGGGGCGCGGMGCNNCPCNRCGMPKRRCGCGPPKGGCPFC